MWSHADRHTYREGGDEVEQAFKALVQHVCVKTPDKADYRHRLAKVGYSLSAYVRTYILQLQWVGGHRCSWSVKEH